MNRFKNYFDATEEENAILLEHLTEFQNPSNVNFYLNYGKFRNKRRKRLLFKKIY